MSDKTSLSDLARKAGFDVATNGRGVQIVVDSDGIEITDQLERLLALHVQELCAGVDPVYQMRYAEGRWMDCGKGDHNLNPGSELFLTRILYRAETVAALQARVAELENKLANIPTEYPGVKCMCVQTKCRAGPGCPHYNKHCEAHIDHIQREALRSKK